MHRYETSATETTDLCTAFHGYRRIAAGPFAEVALAVVRAFDAKTAGPILIYNDTTGAVIDVDLRGTPTEITTRMARFSRPDSPPPSPPAEPDSAVGRPRGRPKLGVVSREVTLLPKHWEWLAQQPGGASVALRRLVEHAQHMDAAAIQRRLRQDAAYRFISSMAGSLPAFEEASRALFSGDPEQFRHYTAAWPIDVREYAMQIAFSDEGDAPPSSLPNT